MAVWDQREHKASLKEHWRRFIMPRVKEDKLATPKASKETSQDRINELVNSSYTKGKSDGRSEMATYVVNFLNQHSAQLFLNGQDDIAKDMRKLTAIIVKEIKGE